MEFSQLPLVQFLPIRSDMQRVQSRSERLENSCRSSFYPPLSFRVGGPKLAYLLLKVASTELASKPAIAAGDGCIVPTATGHTRTQLKTLEDCAQPSTRKGTASEGAKQSPSASFASSRDGSCWEGVERHPYGVLLLGATHHSTTEMRPTRGDRDGCSPGNT